MAAILNVWIAKPGDPCYVDDHEWVVTIFDSDGNVYQYAGTSYGNLGAPQAFWAGTIPPGCYVVQGSGRDANGKDIQTDHAIVEVGCDGLVCVRLYVAGPGDSNPNGCEIKITDVIGIGSPSPTAIRITGTAVNCNQIEVKVSCATTSTGSAVTSVSANGQWTANVNTSGLSCRCNGGVVVHASCTANPKCTTTFKSKLICKKETARQKSRL